MKILIISDAWHPQTNGVVRTYENLQTALTAQGHEVAIIGPDDVALRLPLPGYAEISLALGPFGGIHRRIESFNPDHLHIGTEGTLGRAVRRYCLKTGRPFTTCYHTQFPDYVARRAEKISRKLARRLYRYTLESMKAFHATSAAMMVATDSLEKQLIGQGFRAPLHRLTRGVDFSVFHGGPQTLFGDLPRPVALYVGRVTVEKSIEDFLNAPWSGSKVVVGTGPLLDTLKQAYPAVIFAGKKTGKDLADHYRSADVFAFPSRTDTFGMVLVEAMACGLPIAAYPVTGPIDIVTEPPLGVLDENFGEALNKAVLLIGADRRSAHAREHYSWDEAARQFLAATPPRQG